MIKSGGVKDYTGGEVPINNIDCLKEYKAEKIRIILGLEQYGEVLFRLHKLDEKGEYRIHCLIPVLRSFDGIERFDINAFCGYFRGKLINRAIPTLISNDCVAGMIYKCIGAVNSIAISPTINTRILAEDFLKVVLNPEHYLKCNMVSNGIRLLTGEAWNSVAPTGKIDDVTVYFTHLNDPKEKDVEKCVMRWNFMKENINWNRLAFLVRDWQSFPIDFIKRMRECKYPYRINIRTTESGMDVWDDNKHILFLTKNFSDWSSAVEDAGFDFIGWYNELLDEIEANGRM